MTDKKRDADVHAARLETQKARGETQAARGETQAARNETQGEKTRMQGEANHATGERNTSDIAALTESVDELIDSNRRNEQGISTVAQMMRDARSDRRTGRILAAMVVAVFFVNAWYENTNDRRAADDRALLLQEQQQLIEISERIRSATHPDGCTFRRGQANQAEAIRQIVNDNRVIHKLAPYPQDPTLKAIMETPCPGEPGAPPLVVTTTTTTAHGASSSTARRRSTTTTTRRRTSTQPSRATTTTMRSTTTQPRPTTTQRRCDTPAPTHAQDVCPTVP